MRSELFPVHEGPALMNAAGTVKRPEQALGLVGLPLAAIVLGSYTFHERIGNVGETWYDNGFAALNSMGMPSPSFDIWRGWVTDLAPKVQDAGTQLWVSVAGFSPTEFRDMTEVALEAGADAVELNLGCPNIWAEGLQKPIVSYSVDETALVLEAVKPFALSAMVGAKVSPLLDPLLLQSIDYKIADSPLGFVTSTNTVPNCFALEDGKSALKCEPPIGGLSGPAIKFLGLGQVRQHRELLSGRPIVGVGGISSGRDLSDYLDPLVGADACQVGTAYIRRGASVFVDILHEYVDLACA